MHRGTFCLAAGLVESKKMRFWATFARKKFICCIGGWSCESSTHHHTPPPPPTSSWILVSPFIGQGLHLHPNELQIVVDLNPSRSVSLPWCALYTQAVLWIHWLTTASLASVRVDVTTRHNMPKRWTIRYILSSRFGRTPCGRMWVES